jgi:hypothetical protein
MLVIYSSAYICNALLVNGDIFENRLGLFQLSKLDKHVELLDRDWQQLCSLIFR